MRCGRISEVAGLVRCGWISEVAGLVRWLD